MEVSETKARRRSTATEGVSLPPPVSQASQPPVQVDVLGLVGRIDQGQLTVSVPLVAGAKMGGATVRPGTTANVTLTIRNGDLELQRTGIRFTDESGEPTTLDGPLWIDPDSIYIDADGTIRAEVPCWCDPDVTEDVLGEGITRVPLDPAAYIRLLTQQSYEQGLVHRTAEAGRVPPGEGATPRAPSATGLPEALDLTGTSLKVDGVLKEGPIRFGPGMVLDLKAGTAVRASGSLTAFDAHLDARVRGVEVNAQDTVLRSGPGTVTLDVAMRTRPGAGGPEATTDVTITAFDLQNLMLQAPAAEGLRHRVSLGQVSVGPSDDASAAVRVNVVGEETSLQVALPRVELVGLSGLFYARDLDNKLVSFSVDREAGQVALRGTGSLAIDSAAKSLTLRADLAALNATLEGLTVDSETFDLISREIQVTGGAQLSVESQGENTRVDVRGQQGRPLQARVQVQDAFIGRRDANSFTADLAEDTTGEAALHHLSVGGERAAVAGDLRLNVTLDALHFPLEGGDIRLAPGSRGTLELSNFSWSQGDVAPATRVTLEIDAGVLATADIERLSRLDRGVRVRVDTQTGNAYLRVEGELAADGSLTLAGNLRLRGARISAQGTRGSVTQAPPVELSADRLGALQAIRLAARRRDNPTFPTEAPTLPAITVTPSRLVQSLGGATIAVRVPTRVVALSPAVERSATWRSVRGTVALHLQRPAGPISAQLTIANGQLGADGSRVTLAPPLTVRLTASGALGRLGLNTGLEARVEGLRLVRAPGGRVRLQPEITWLGTAGRIVSAVDFDAFDLDTWIEEELGAQVAKLILGERVLPASLETLMVAVVRAHPEVGQSITVDPNRPPEIDLGPSVHEYFDLQNAQLSLSNAHFRSDRTTVIDLGNDQVIELLPGTSVSMEGTLGNYTISGRARLGRVRLGGGQTFVGLQGAQADLRVHVQNDSQGRPRVQVQLDGLSTRNFHVRGATGGDQPIAADVTLESVEGARVHLDYRAGERPDFSVSVPAGGTPLALAGGLSLGDGRQVRIQDATARSLHVASKGAAQISITNLQARVSGRLAVPMPDSSARPVVEIREARLRGDLTAVAQGFIGRSPLRLEDLNASIFDLPVATPSGLSVRFGQVDLTGSYRLMAEGQGRFVLERQSAEGGAQGTVSALRFRHEEPPLTLETEESRFQIGLRRAEFSPQGFGIEIDGGWVDGTLKGGQARVSASGVVQDLTIPRGARFRATVPSLTLRPGGEGAVDATLRVEGQVLHPQRPGSLALNGSARLVLRVMGEGRDDYGVALQGEIDVDAGWQGTVRLPPVPTGGAAIASPLP